MYKLPTVCLKQQQKYFVVEKNHKTKTGSN